MANEKKRKKRGTKTSSFGAAGRIAHDSSLYYGRRLYEGLPQEKLPLWDEKEVPYDILDNVLNKSAESMDELPDSSVHLMVTSPPYNVGKDYDEDLSLDEYRAFLKRVMAEVYRVLVPGGRACINIANLGRRPYLPLHAFVIQDMLSLDFLMRGEVIWEKGSSASPSTAWGSWMSPTNPTLRDTHEYILIFCKQSFTRPNPEKRVSTIERDGFLQDTKSVWKVVGTHEDIGISTVWDFPAEQAKRVGHPAPFPVDLPYRLIQLYTFEGEVVLDPFMGSGTSAVAAVKAGHHFVGYEIDSDYIAIAERRIKEISQSPGLPFFEAENA